MRILDMLPVVAELEDRIGKLPVGDPQLGEVTLRIGELQRELERTRGGLGALVPDAASPPSADEAAAADLDRTLRSLMSAAQSKRQP